MTELTDDSTTIKPLPVHKPAVAKPIVTKLCPFCRKSNQYWYSMVLIPILIQHDTDTYTDTAWYWYLYWYSMILIPIHDATNIGKVSLSACHSSCLNNTQTWFLALKMLPLKFCGLYHVRINTGPPILQATKSLAGAWKQGYCMFIP